MKILIAIVISLGDGRRAKPTTTTIPICEYLSIFIEYNWIRCITANLFLIRFYFAKHTDSTIFISDWRLYYTYVHTTQKMNSFNTFFNWPDCCPLIIDVFHMNVIIIEIINNFKFKMKLFNFILVRWYWDNDD